MSIKNIFISLFGGYTQEDLESLVQNVKTIMNCTIAAKQEQIRMLKAKNKNLEAEIAFLKKAAKSETLVEKDIHELFELKTDFTKIYFDGKKDKALNIFVSKKPTTVYVENKDGVTVTRYSNNVPKEDLTLAEAGKILVEKPFVSRVDSGNK